MTGMVQTEVIRLITGDPCGPDGKWKIVMDMIYGTFPAWMMAVPLCFIPVFCCGQGSGFPTVTSHSWLVVSKVKPYLDAKNSWTMPIRCHMKA